MKKRSQILNMRIFWHQRCGDIELVSRFIEKTKIVIGDAETVMAGFVVWIALNGRTVLCNVLIDDRMFERIQINTWHVHFN